MMANAEYDALTELDDPDVAFLAGSDNLEMRPGTRKRSRSAGAAPRPIRPSRFCSTRLWIVVLLLVVGALLVALGVILYRRSQTDLERLKFEDNSQSSASTPSGKEKNSVDVVTSAPPAITVATTQIASTLAPTKDKSAELAKCAYQGKRLPITVTPSLYSVNLTLLNITDGHYTGTIRINLTASAPISVIVLHSKNLTIVENGVHLTTGGGTVLLSGVVNCEVRDQLQISTRQPLQPATVYQLEITFSGLLRDDMHGFYRSDYLDDKGVKQYIATTQFEDTHAREAFPCFDEPAMKAIFQLQLTHNRSLLALSNMPAKLKVEDPTKGITTTTFEDTPRMSTYLAAFILSDFDKNTTKTKDGVDVSVYSVRHKLNQTGFALSTAVAVLTYYETFFAIKYPLKKLDLVAIPDFSAGAMENWGLITFREASLLYDNALSPLHQMDYVTKVVTHEIAHQWFGNLVTMTWWDQLWLNEGFATFMTYLGAEVAQKQLNSWQRIVSDTVQMALQLDILVNTHPVVMDVLDTEDIASRFDTISYNKGASVLLMLYEFLGEKVFQTGVSSYLNEHKFGNAQTDDLWTSLNVAWKATGNAQEKTVKEIAESWITQPGFPLITATRQGGQISVTQKRLLSLNETVESNLTWIVPVGIFDSSTPNVSHYLLTSPKATINLPSAAATWYKLNSRQTSYFRTNYDSDNWIALTKALMTDPDVMSPEDRANLIDDAFSLSRAGKLNITVLLNLISYLPKETHYLPWLSAKPDLDGLESNLFQTDSFMRYRRWRRNMVEKIFSTADCLSVPENNILRRRFCIILFDDACRLEVPQCIEQARKLYKDIKDGKKVPVDMLGTVYETVIEHGDDVLWNEVWKYHENTQVASEKSITLNALANSQNPWIIERFLRYSLDPLKVRPGETIAVLSSLTENYAARPLVWRTVRQNYDLLYTRYGWDSSMANIFSLLDFMIGDDDARELKTFFQQPDRKLGAGALALNQTLEAIDLRRSFLKLYSGDISDWLTSQKV